MCVSPVEMNLGQCFAFNQSSDPTHTLTLRRAFVADMSRRFRKLEREQWEAVAVQDVFRTEERAEERSRVAGIVAQVAVWLARNQTDAPRFLARRDDQAVDEYMRWLRQKEREGILEIIPGENGQLEPWSNFYVRSAYQRGMRDANIRLGRLGVIDRAGPDAARALFYSPFHQERVRLMYTRVWSDLEGITEQMNARIRRVLSQGLIEGVGANELARRMNDVIEIRQGLETNTRGMRAIERGRLLARTSIVETYNTAANAEYERASALIGEQVYVEWDTSEDELVRTSHRERHNKRFTRAGGQSLLGDPNCRCALLPWIESVQGDADLSDASAFLRG